MGAVTHVCAHLAEVEGLKEMFRNDRDTQKGLEEQVSLLKDEAVEAYVHILRR